MQTTRYSILRDQQSWKNCVSHNAVVNATGDLRLPVLEADEHNFLTQGNIKINALDAGESTSWQRVVVEADIPVNTRLRVFVAAKKTPDIPINANAFVEAQALDFFLPSVLNTDATTDNSEINPERFRYLWVIIQLESQDTTQTPRLLQVRAQTAGENYINELPAVYQKEDASNEFFLTHFLELLGAEFGDLDRLLTDIPRRFDPQTAYPQDFSGLAQWLGWDSLPDCNAQALRDLLQDLHLLNQQRGTLQGLEKIILTFTGIQVHIVEHFTQRVHWHLGEMQLGVNTGLSLLPEGMIVPGCADIADNETGQYFPVVGQAVVGQQGPLEKADYGMSLFDEDAFRFTVFVPPGTVCTETQKVKLRTLIDQEKPAFSDYHLCFLQRLELGVSDRLDINAYIGEAYEAKPLGGLRLGWSSYVADPQGTIRLQTGEKFTQ
jgi:phage tail-like protein